VSVRLYNRVAVSKISAAERLASADELRAGLVYPDRHHDFPLEHFMHAEIIAIGTELTSGATLDTNSQWLSLQLASVGIPVRYHLTVADEMPAMVAAFRAAVNRSDVVLVTGGLGPTRDDLTRQALAELADVKLELHEPSLEFIKSLFAKRNFPMPESNVIQAMFPAGSEPLTNPRGTAPGIWMELGRKGNDVPSKVAALPGVPSEMKRMFQKEVLPKLGGGNNVIRRARVHCFGLGESAAEEMLGDLTERGRDPEVGITVHEATITLRIVAHGKSEQECDEKIASTKQSIHEIMGEYVFGTEDEELEDVVVAMLNERGMTLATAEQGTGGLLAHRLTNVSNRNRCYSGGTVLPLDAIFEKPHPLACETVENAKPGSGELAEAMARSCREQFDTDYALAATNCPPDDAHGDGESAPALYLALVGEAVLEVRKHTLIGDKTLVKSRATKALLNLLRLHLTRVQDAAR
jgi:nicotinamide-nucleotide amidase